MCVGSRRDPKGKDKCPRKESTPPASRSALEERLKRIAREEGVDLQRLRRQVAFDRFLARLFPTATDWILKGRYAMELRFQTARAPGISISRCELHRPVTRSARSTTTKSYCR